MASYTEHLAQAKKNLLFLKEINHNIANCVDWQITVSFYAAVHLINAYLAEKAGFHYRSHEHIDIALNPANTLSTVRVSEDVYLAYKRLSNLSRRSRYLISDNPDNKDVKAHYVSEKYLARSFDNLDKIISMIATIYDETFEALDLHCENLDKRDLKYFLKKNTKMTA